MSAPFLPRSVTTRLAHVEVHAVQNVRFAVPGVQTSNLKHGLLEVGLDDLRILRHGRVIAFREDSSLRWSTVILSDSVETTERLCSTISTVRLADTRLMSAVMRSTSECVIPAVGSSSSIIWVERERGGDLERALAPVGQLDRHRLLEVRQAHRLDQLSRRIRRVLLEHLFDRQKSNEAPRLR